MMTEIIAEIIADIHKSYTETDESMSGAHCLMLQLWPGVKQAQHLLK